MNNDNVDGVCTCVSSCIRLETGYWVGMGSGG